MSVIEEIAVERKRQIEVEGWHHAHDDEHDTGNLAVAAASYAIMAASFNYASALKVNPPGNPPAHFPWDERFWKPKGPRRDLIRAAALIVAEIERLDRKSP